MIERELVFFHSCNLQGLAQRDLWGQHWHAIIIFNPVVVSMVDFSFQNIKGSSSSPPLPPLPTWNEWPRSVGDNYPTHQLLGFERKTGASVRHVILTCRLPNVVIHGMPSILSLRNGERIVCETWFWGYDDSTRICTVVLVMDILPPEFPFQNIKGSSTSRPPLSNEYVPIVGDGYPTPSSRIWKENRCLGSVISFLNMSVIVCRYPWHPLSWVWELCVKLGAMMTQREYVPVVLVMDILPLELSFQISKRFVYATSSSFERICTHSVSDDEFERKTGAWVRSFHFLTCRLAYVVIHGTRWENGERVNVWKLGFWGDDDSTR